MKTIAELHKIARCVDLQIDTELDDFIWCVQEDALKDVLIALTDRGLSLIHTIYGPNRETWTIKENPYA